MFAFIVLFMAVVGGAAGMAIDVGAYTMQRRDLQNAADAIALAAAQELPSSDAAQNKANTYKTKNDQADATMNVVITQQNLPSVANPSVKVTLTKSHSFVFGRLIGLTSKDVSATATAIRTSPGGFGGGLMPWSVTEAHKNSASAGTSLTLKYDAGDSTNGNFGALRLDGNGANIYEDTIVNGSENSFCAAGVSGCPHPTTVNTQTGNMRGPTSDGVDYRITNTSSACNTWSEVVAESGGKHLIRPECNPFGGSTNASLRVIVIPVINSLCNGNCTVTIKEFALFFLEGYGPGGCANGNTCEVRGKFINSNTNMNALTGVYDSDTTTAHFVRLTQ